MNNFVCEYHPKFIKGCKKSSSKCPSVEEDLRVFKTALIDDIVKNGGFVPCKKDALIHVNNLKSKLPVFKFKRFRCQDINKGNRSPFRIIFAYDMSLSLIYFIEFYYKKNDDTEMNKKLAIKACEFILNG